MELMGMSMGMGVGVGVGSSPPPSSSRITNPKKKRRTNNKTAQATQRTPAMKNFVPPPLSEFRNSAAASNPFDDTLQLAMNPSCMYSGLQQMHPHHPHNMMGNPQMQGMNPLAADNMNPMMFYMSNVNHIGDMGNFLHTNHSSINYNMNPMNNMRPNIPQGSMGPMNNHMNINHMINSQIGGPGMNSPINGSNHDLGSPMGGPIGSPINNMSPNHIASNTLNAPARNPANTDMSYSAAQFHTDHLNNIHPGLNIPHNMPFTTMYSTTLDAILGNTEMNNFGMIKPQMPNGPNINPIAQSNQMEHMGNLMGNITNNLTEKSPIHEMNIGNPMPQHGLQEPPALEREQIPESSAKVYPPNETVVFNNQNPNALPILPCGVCHKEVRVNDQSILCESGCNFWFHRICTGLTEIAYNFLMNENGAEWACDRCIQTKNISLVKFAPMPQHGLQGPPAIEPEKIPEPSEKIYPSNQNMVFNDQNPDAPPISPCGICHKEVHPNDQAVLCESGCHFWFHRKCAGLSEVAYNFLMLEICAEWRCDKCMQTKDISLVKFKP